MSVTGEEIVKVDFNNIGEYQIYLSQLAMQMETVIYGMQDVGNKLTEMTDFSKNPPSGTTKEYDVLNKYISEMTKVLYSIHDMQYATDRYVEYYDNLGVYEQGNLVYDEEAVDNVLTNFENLIYDGDWSTGLETNSFGFEIWENGILAGVDFIDSDRERAVRYNKKILDDLNDDLSRMKDTAVSYTDELRDSSGVYKMNLKPLADGVTVNSILQAFDIEDIDYQMLKAGTEILGNIKGVMNKLEPKLEDTKKDIELETAKKAIKTLESPSIKVEAGLAKAGFNEDGSLNTFGKVEVGVGVAVGLVAGAIIGADEAIAVGIVAEDVVGSAEVIEGTTEVVTAGETIIEEESIVGEEIIETEVIANEIETISVDELPENVQKSYKNYTEYTNKKGKSPWNNNAGPKPGRAGKKYYNSDGKLPDGNYKEYDVNAQTGETRDEQRFLRNEETGEIYYTADHYDTFLKIGE